MRMSDVVVLGSGAAGLAVAAADRGATVTLLESEAVAGGTTALSGAISWLPAHGRGAVTDTPAEALRYLAGFDTGDFDEAQSRVFVERARWEADEIERLSAVCRHTVPYPDYHAERPGGQPGGRALEPDPLVPEPAVARLVRPAPNVPVPITYAQLITGEIDPDEIRGGRQAAGVLTMGRALVGSLLAAALDRGVDLRLGVRARRLVRDGDRVVGVAGADGATVPGSVVLATGGFGRDPALARALPRCASASTWTASISTTAARTTFGASTPRRSGNGWTSSRLPPPSPAGPGVGWIASCTARRCATGPAIRLPSPTSGPTCAPWSSTAASTSSSTGSTCHGSRTASSSTGR